MDYFHRLSDRHFRRFSEVLFVSEMGNKYQGVPLMGTDAEEHYLASMRESYDGRYILSNVYSIPKKYPVSLSGGRRNDSRFCQQNKRSWRSSLQYCDEVSVALFIILIVIQIGSFN